MTKENSDALQSIVDTIDYVVGEKVKKASYDITRNARIKKVYWDSLLAEQIITGYDIEIDGKSYYIAKPISKGIVAKENDIVKLHFPCNNPNNMYLSYANDSANFINSEIFSVSDNYNLEEIIWNNGRKKYTARYTFQVTFPSTTEQLSVVDTFSIKKFASNQESISITSDNGVFITINEDLTTNSLEDIKIKIYNQNESTESITKTIHVNVVEFGQSYNIQDIDLYPNL